MCGSDRWSASASSAANSVLVPIAMSTWPPASTWSGVGFVRNEPSGSRKARTRAPVWSRMCASTDAAADQDRVVRHRDLLETELDVLIVHHDVEELGDVRLEDERGGSRAADVSVD